MTSPLVKRFLISFDRHKLIGLFCFVFVVGLSGVVAMLPPPDPTPDEYRATGILRSETPPPTFTNTGKILQEQGQATISQELLLNDAVVKPVLEAVDVKLKTFFDNIKVELPEDNKDKEGPLNIQLKYKDSERDRAQQTLDLLMENMVQQSRTINTSRLRATIDSLENRLVQAKQEVQAAEQKYYRYVSQQGSSLIAAEDGTLFSSISAAQQTQRQIRLELEGVESAIASISSQLGLNPDQAYTASALSADPIIGSLRAQILEVETQIKRLERDLRPEHPQMKELFKQQQAAEKLLQERATEIIGDDGILVPLPSKIRQSSSLDPARQDLANQLVTLNTQRDTLVTQLQSVQRTEQELRQQYEKFPTKQLEKGRLEQALALKKDLYGKMLSQLLDAQAAEAETVGSLTIAQPAVVAKKVGEVKPGINPAIAIGGGTVLGFLAAGGIIFLLAILDSRLYATKEIRDILSDREVAFLGELPWVFNLDEFQDESPIVQRYNSSDLHYYELLRSNIQQGAAKSAKVLLMTSTSPEEGKTVTAYNLAIAAASAGKRTLLLEADLRSPSASAYLQVEPDPDAQLEPLSYYSSRSDYLQLAPGIENLYLVPGAGPQPQAAAILEASEMKRLLEDARGRFDLVIIDTPSLLSNNDALLLEPQADGIVLVVRPGIAQKSLLESTLDRLIEAELPLLGAAINGIDTHDLLAAPAMESAAVNPALPQTKRSQEQFAMVEGKNSDP